MFTCTAIVSFFAFLTRFLETPITIMYEPSATSRMAVLRSFHPSLPSSYPPSSNFWPFAFLFHYKSTRLFSWPSQPFTPFPPSFLPPFIRDTILSRVYLSGKRGRKSKRKMSSLFHSRRSPHPSSCTPAPSFFLRRSRPILEPPARSLALSLFLSSSI